MDNSKHFAVLTLVDNVKEKLTDAEYKDIMDGLCELRDTNRLRYNKSIVIDMLDCILSSVIVPNQGVANVAALRPLEAINIISSLMNIIVNLKTMTDEPEVVEDGGVADKRHFIFSQLGTSFTGDYHKTALQLLNYKNCKEIVELIDSMALAS